jgi:hypothetical protein
VWRALPQFDSIPAVRQAELPVSDESRVASIANATNKDHLSIFAPPSEPDWPISGIRLSSWWLTFKKIGMPQCALALRHP